MSDSSPFSASAPETPDMHARLRRLLGEMAALEPSPARSFLETWKNARFANPGYARLVYKVYNYLHNPELNLRFELFEANADAVVGLLQDVLGEARTALEAADPEKAKDIEGELRITQFVARLLEL